MKFKNVGKNKIINRSVHLMLDSDCLLADVPKILSPPEDYTVMFFQAANLHCRYSASGPVTIRWQLGNKIIAIKQLNG